jgi:hypothetical protein
MIGLRAGRNRVRISDAALYQRKALAGDTPFFCSSYVGSQRLPIDAYCLLLLVGHPGVNDRECRRNWQGTTGVLDVVAGCQRSYCIDQRGSSAGDQSG